MINIVIYTMNMYENFGSSISACTRKRKGKQFNPFHSDEKPIRHKIMQTIFDDSAYYMVFDGEQL